MSVVQSDLALIKALNEAIGYLRQNPFHLDFIFESVLGDNLNKEFGKQEIDRAKKWFLSTHIPVVSVWRLDKPQYPIVTVSVKSSVESPGKASLGEADTETFDYDETVEKQGYVPTPSILLGPFSPSYDSTTGTVTLPDGFDTSLVFVNQQLQVPSTGNAYTITAVTSDTEFVIDTDLSENMTGAYTISAYNSLKVVRRVSLFDEKYEINMIVAGSPGELYWLSSIIQYLLLQRRQYLLEKFNISLSSISLGEISQEQDGPEQFFIRTISMDGYVENRWVDNLSEYIEGITGEMNLVTASAGPTFSQADSSVGFSISNGVAASSGGTGADGATGPAGADGATGPAGADGATGAQGPPGPSTRVLTDTTIDLALTAADTGHVVTNRGAVSNITVTLPPSATLSGGELFRFRVSADTYYVKALSAGTDVIYDYNQNSTAAGFMRANIKGATLELEYQGSGEFWATAVVGDWSIDQ